MEDGPGIRSVVFFNGCPLSCYWCQNPEGKSESVSLVWDEKLCISDGSCIEVCPEGALSFDLPEMVDRKKCTNCFVCVKICLTNALMISAESKTVEEVVDTIMPYYSFFENTGGGVTLSGGEAMQQMEFASALLKQLKKRGIHTLIETSGYFEFKQFESKILPYLDAIYFDLKIINPSLHKECCGVDNERILNNFGKIVAIASKSSLSILPRIPLIPGVTDTIENIKSIIRILKELDIQEVALLPYNPAWIDKLKGLGINHSIDLDTALGKLYPDNTKDRIKLLFMDNGIDVI